MPSLSSIILKLHLRFLKPFIRFADVETSRKAQDKLGKLGAKAHQSDVAFYDVQFDNFSACFATPKGCVKPKEHVVLYLHGGAYTAGSLDYARGFGSVVASSTTLNVFCVAYRLAPEHMFPAALDDVLCAYDYLLASGFKPEHIAFAGESAGGGLVYCLALKLKQLKRPLPAALVGISPWTDLTLSGASYLNNVLRDPTLSRSAIIDDAIMYAEGRRRNPFVSPIFGELDGLPPSLIFVGGSEILLDDAKTLANKLEEYGNRCELIISPGMWHVYPLFGTPEARAAIKRMTEFLQEAILGDDREDIKR
ncbi:MAG: alpha/beta hydrolase [Clostridia bacterium]